MPMHCGIFACKNNLKRIRKSFYRLPSVNSRSINVMRLSVLRRTRWLLAIKRKDITETKAKYLRVCEDHFVTGKPAKLEDSKHPDWVPCINLGYGNTSDPKYIQSLKEKVKKHVENASPSKPHDLGTEGTNASIDQTNVNIPGPIDDINDYQYVGDINACQRNNTDKQIANDTDGNKNDSQRKVMIFYTPNNNQGASFCSINNSTTQTKENIDLKQNFVWNPNLILRKNTTKLQPTSLATFKAKAKKSFKPKSYKVPSYSIGVTSSVTDTDYKVSSKNVNATSTMTGIDGEVSYNVADVTDIDNQLPFNMVDELDDCNLSTPFLNNLTQLREFNSVGVQTDLKTSDLDHLNNYCVKLKKKLTEANKQIKMLTLLLKSSKES